MNKKSNIFKKNKNLYMFSGIVLFFMLVCVSAFFCWPSLLSAWERYLYSFEKNLKFGFVTDVEYGYKNKVGNKLTKQGLIELEKVIEYFNNEFKPEIIIEGGDMVESSIAKKNTTINQFNEINAVYSRFNGRKEYILGNHDLRNLSKEEVREIFKLEGNHKYFDIGDWRFVLMDTNFNSKEQDLGPTFYAAGFVSQNEFRWLKEALTTERPVILFSHHPIFPLHKKNIGNGDKLKEFLENYDNVVMCIAGHDPNFRYNESNGIHYLVVDNLANIDSVGSFATIEAKTNMILKEASLTVEHYGPNRQTINISKRLGETNKIEIARSLINSLK